MDTLFAFSAGVDVTFYIGAFVTLFVVIDPIGLTPLYVALTAGENAQRRRAIAIRSCVLSAVLLTLFGFFGEAVLGFAGISMAAFRISGGILLFLTALEMLFERRTKRREDQAEHERPDPSVFPLAIPLIAGPGSIASMILLAGQTDGSFVGIFSIVVVMFAVILLVFLLFSLAPILERGMGKTGIAVVTRLLGMLLAALSIQFVLDGVRSFADVI